jgi:predicted 2-oxoglutarate/Fe(II)-dependent dioxygenase YbiX
VASPQSSGVVGVGDPMPRITLPLAAGGLFDSWDPRSAGRARIYWLGTPPEEISSPEFAERLTCCETLMHLVRKAKTDVPQPQTASGTISWLLDPRGELTRLFAASEPFLIFVDAAGRVAAVLPQPALEQVSALAERLHAATQPTVVQAQAPVLLLERVVEPDLCQALIGYWQDREKIANAIDAAAAGGNVASADHKRRQDVQVDDPPLLARVRTALTRRLSPLILQAFHTATSVMEAPVVGCYDQASGGWFRRHRDNTTPLTANRQFAVSINLNGGDEYDGGEVRFPEFGRELYRPVAGGALVFSCSLLHEVVPVTRGRRIGLFTFMSKRGRDPAIASRPAPGNANRRS